MKRHYITRMEIYFLIIFLLLPLLTNRTLIAHLLVIAGTYAIAAMGLSLFLGVAGQISIGHAAFFGIGGYTHAILSVRFGVPGVLAMVAGGVAAGIFARIIARPLLKLREYFLALATMGLVVIFQMVATEWGTLTGGVSGIGNIPWVSLFGVPLDTPLKQFYWVWGIAYLFFIFARNLIHSKYGKAAASVALNETVAGTVGVDPGNIKQRYWVLSAVYAGVGGALFASVLTSVSPESFGLNLSVMLVMMVLLGGTTSPGGSVFGAIFLTWLLHRLGAYRAYSLPLLGLLLISLLVVFPEGIFRGIGARWHDLVRIWAPAHWRKEIEK
ncbi:MAG: branched-chain amino acid ABC transporter permease [Desulfobacterales bacterium]|jgi:branched-chain amino acid transport system permease protein|nr:branched-chain amino acid ABC transporter permease [Desulfobacterales bacterium]